MNVGKIGFVLKWRISRLAETNGALRLSLSEILHIVLIFQGFSIALFLLLTKRGKASVNIILAFILLTLTIHMILNFLEADLDLGITKLNYTLGFLYGPLIWIYVYNIINEGQTKSRRYLLLFGPFVLSTFTLFLLNYSFFGPLILIQTLIYLVLSVKEIRRYNMVIKQTNANSDVSLTWLNQFIGGVIVLFLFDLIRNIVAFEQSTPGNEFLYNTLVIILIVMINLVVFKSINHSTKFLGISEIDKKIEKEKRTNSLDLDASEIESLAKSLESFLIENGTFRRAELSIVEFSAFADQNPRIVSQVINHYFGTNFSDWINNHRLDYAKNQLRTTTSREKNISQILYESGFNSVSSFYTAFSKKVGISPKDYRRKFESG